ncbi:FUSC family protein, partial [Variovorax sp.]
MATLPFADRLAFLREPGRWRAGAQLAAAVAIAWGVSRGIGLPESFWAVMSVLIVMRPSAGSTLEAGWDRVRGTFAGALAGLAGVWLAHHGVPMQADALAIVLLLAFVGAAVPGLRSAPVAALIILSAGSLPGHSALQVALLRMAQMGIGVGVALAMALVTAEYRAGARFDAGCAALLRGMAKRLLALAAGDATEGDGER